jgi:hypothetical protein
LSRLGHGLSEEVEHRAHARRQVAALSEIQGVDLLDI